MLLPEKGPWLTWRAADEDVGMVKAFFVADSQRIIVSGEAAAGEDCVRLFLAEPESDDGGGRRNGVAAIPF